MRVEKIEEDMFCYLSQLEEEIKILKNNIEEFKKILENVKRITMLKNVSILISKKDLK